MAKGGKFLDFLASIAPHLLGFGSNIMTNLFNKKFADEANKTNLEIARQTNEANMQMTNATNLANRELVREQNEAAAAEAEKAYQRSKPTTQVANMQAAGMSLAGAINSLNGGGSYSPAPVNVSSDEASRNQSAQVSPAQLMSSEGVFANIANTFMQREQIKSSERLQRESLQQQAVMQREQIASNERIANLQANTTNRNADNRLAFERLVHLNELQFKNEDLQFRKQQYEYGKKLLDAQTSLTETQRDKIRAELDDFSSDPAKTAREAEYQTRRMAALYNYNVNENDFYSYLRDNYVKGEDGNYYPVPKLDLPTIKEGKVGKLNYVGDKAKAFWDMMFSIIPVRSLFDCIKLFAK